MKDYQHYYKNILYPLQDKVLALFKKNETPFYLTGGTTLSRVYFNHRYSDDLDFFLNNSSEFAIQVEKCEQLLRHDFGNKLEKTLSFDSFIRYFVHTDEADLKLEFINDVSYHQGNFITTSLFHKIDNVSNILSNKICALNRNAAKDYADIWIIAQNFEFNWQEIINEAKNKDTWVDESDVVNTLYQFDLSDMKDIKWIQSLDLVKAENDFKIILKDILTGLDNSLCKKHKG